MRYVGTPYSWCERSGALSPVPSVDAPIQPSDHVALLSGTAWGAAMSLFLIVTKEGPILLALVVGLGSGLLLFGPGVVLLSRRYRTSDDGCRNR